MPTAPISATLDHCPICKRECSDLFALPSLPITGVYSVTRQHAIVADNSFAYCNNCGHGFLRNVVDPKFLYLDTYTHRSSGSPISRGGNDFLLSFIAQQTKKPPTRILEIGCNDLYLLGKLAGQNIQAFGVDPIWEGRSGKFGHTNIHLFGGFAGSVEIAGADLIVSAHTFEHMSDPLEQLTKLVEQAAPGADFFIEVPSLDTQIQKRRYDQVFHQHIQYFSLASMQRLIYSAGARYVSHAINHRYWGGTLLVHFRKAQLEACWDSTPYAPSIAKGYNAFTEACEQLAEDISKHRGTLYAYGAAQMATVLFYHLKLGTGCLKAIIDDHPDRVGKYLVGCDWPIIDVPSDIENAGVVITALDSQRPILKRLLDLDPRVVFRPLTAM